MIMRPIGDWILSCAVKKEAITVIGASAGVSTNSYSVTLASGIVENTSRRTTNITAPHACGVLFAGTIGI